MPVCYGIIGNIRGIVDVTRIILFFFFFFLRLSVVWHGLSSLLIELYLTMGILDSIAFSILTDIL